MPDAEGQSMKSTVEVLREARELISDPERWGQGAAGSWGADGKPCHWANPLARKFCASNALCRVGREPYPSASHATLAQAVGVSVPVFNDWPGRTHAEVLAAFDRAIELAEAKS